MNVEPQNTFFNRSFLLLRYFLDMIFFDNLQSGSAWFGSCGDQGAALSGGGPDRGQDEVCGGRGVALHGNIWYIER